MSAQRHRPPLPARSPARPVLHRHSIRSRRRKNVSSGSAYGWPVSSRSRSAPRSRSARSSPRSNASVRRAKWARSPRVTGVHPAPRPRSPDPTASRCPPPAARARADRSSCSPTTSCRRASRPSTASYPVAMKSESTKMIARRRSVGSSSVRAAARSVPVPRGAKASRSLMSRSDVPPTLGGRQVILDPVGEEERADPVVVARGRQRQHRGHLGAELALGAQAAAEPARRAHGPPRTAPRARAPRGSA